MAVAVRRVRGERRQIAPHTHTLHRRSPGPTQNSISYPTSCPYPQWPPRPIPFDRQSGTRHGPRRQKPNTAQRSLSWKAAVIRGLLIERGPVGATSTRLRALALRNRSSRWERNCAKVYGRVHVHMPCRASVWAGLTWIIILPPGDELLGCKY